MKDEPTIYIVDDDTSVLQSMSFLFQTESIPCKTYDSFAAYKDDTNLEAPGCLLLDLRLEGETGDAILETLRARVTSHAPVIFMSGAGDVSTAVKCIKLGAVDFLEKPIAPRHLVEKVRDAFLLDSQRRHEISIRNGARQHIATLTARERELAQHVCEGLSNKQIAARLGISKNTVANHRANILAKMKALNTADLVRIGMIGGGFSVGSHAEREKEFT